MNGLYSQMVEVREQKPINGSTPNFPPLVDEYSARGMGITQESFELLQERWGAPPPRYQDDPEMARLARQLFQARLKRPRIKRQRPHYRLFLDRDPSSGRTPNP